MAERGKYGPMAASAYIVLPLLIGARTEDSALTWDDVGLKGDAKSKPPLPPSISVDRSGGRAATP